jgi:hypothetical protein
LNAQSGFDDHHASSWSFLTHLRAQSNFTLTSLAGPPGPVPSIARSNYRACVRAHKMALSAQRALWMALLHDTIHFKNLQRSFAAMNMVGGWRARLGLGW